MEADLPALAFEGDVVQEPGGGEALDVDEGDAAPDEGDGEDRSVAHLRAEVGGAGLGWDPELLHLAGAHPAL